MNKRSLQFVCVKCLENVFRIGRKVNLSLKLCGKCTKLSGYETVPVLEKVPYNLPQLPQVGVLLQEGSQPLVDQFTDLASQTMHYKIQYYRDLLNKVEELSTKNVNKTFYELWNTAKEL